MQTPRLSRPIVLNGLHPLLTWEQPPPPLSSEVKPLRPGDIALRKLPPLSVSVSERFAISFSRRSEAHRCVLLLGEDLENLVARTDLDS